MTAPAGLDEVDRLLAGVLRRESEVLLEVGPELAAMARTATDLAGGGKRIRASFCLVGAEGAEGAPAAAAALEMFHLGALVHDDVMDRSDLRRGRPTAHQRFAADHRREGLVGDAAGHGDAVATLLGDLCFSWADDLLCEAISSAGERGRAAREVWQRMRTQTMAGQYLDLLAQARGAAPAELTSRVLRYKSASYTVEHPLVLGGSLAGGPAELLAGYAELGRGVGEAFQLRDDVLGVFGDSRTTGKPSLDDVREGKHTVLVAHAQERATVSQRRVLDRHLGDPDLDLAGLEAVRAVLTETGAVRRVEERIDVLTADAHDLLATLPVDPTVRAALSGLVDASAWRAA